MGVPALFVMRPSTQAPKHLAQFMEREASTWFEKVVQIRPSLILECCAKDTGVKIRRRG